MGGGTRETGGGRPASDGRTPADRCDAAVAGAAEAAGAGTAGADAGLAGAEPAGVGAAARRLALVPATNMVVPAQTVSTHRTSAAIANRVPFQGGQSVSASSAGRLVGDNARVDVMDLTGSTVIVTGASSGIGAATARLLHEAGAHPVLAARRAGRIEALGQELGGALAVPTDITDAAAIRHLVETALDRHGRIDGLVNNAGVSLHTPLDQLDLDEFARVLGLNVISVVAMTQAVLPAMRAQGSGRIVNISSGTTRAALPGVGAYAATKSAVNMLTSVARKELEGDRIAVSLVLPSITATEFAGGRFQPGQQARPGMIAHSPGYVGRVILRALRTGEERIDIPHGPEQAGMTAIPGS
jgi:NADP-dependent 3-hydroxy acid dehydrogenase YdfG